MEPKRCLIKLTEKGHKLYGSYDTDISKPFLVIGVKDRQFLHVSLREKLRLGIYPKDFKVRTSIWFRHYKTDIHDPSIIIIHEDI